MVTRAEINNKWAALINHLHVDGRDVPAVLQEVAQLVILEREDYFDKKTHPRVSKGT